MIEFQDATNSQLFGVSEDERVVDSDHQITADSDDVWLDLPVDARGDMSAAEWLESLPGRTETVRDYGIRSTRPATMAYCWVRSADFGDEPGTLRWYAARMAVPR